MAKEIGWDYSRVPRKSWEWEVEPRDFMEAQITPEGIRYMGDLQAMPYGGPYTGGFQTFEEFLDQDGIQNMPGEYAKEIRQHLLEHRVPGGPSIHILLGYGSKMNRHSEFRFSRIFFGLDEVSIKTEINIPEFGEEHLTIFKGSLPPGDHMINYALVFELRGGSKPSTRIVYGKCRFSTYKANHVLKILVVNEENQEITMQASLDRVVIPLFDEKQR